MWIAHRLTKIYDIYYGQIEGQLWTLFHSKDSLDDSHLARAHWDEESLHYDDPDQRLYFEEQWFELVFRDPESLLMEQLL